MPSGRMRPSQAGPRSTVPASGEISVATPGPGVGECGAPVRRDVSLPRSRSFFLCTPLPPSVGRLPCPLIWGGEGLDQIVLSAWHLLHLRLDRKGRLGMAVLLKHGDPCFGGTGWRVFGDAHTKGA